MRPAGRLGPHRLVGRGRRGQLRGGWPALGRGPEWRNSATASKRGSSRTQMLTGWSGKRSATLPAWFERRHAHVISAVLTSFPEHAQPAHAAYDKRSEQVGPFRVGVGSIGASASASAIAGALAALGDLTRCLEKAFGHQGFVGGLGRPHLLRGRVDLPAMYP